MFRMRPLGFGPRRWVGCEDFPSKGHRRAYKVAGRRDGRAEIEAGELEAVLEAEEPKKAEDAPGPHAVWCRCSYCTWGEADD